MDLGFCWSVKSQVLLKTRKKISGVYIHKIHSKISFALGIPNRLLKRHWFNWSSVRKNIIVAFEAERKKKGGEREKSKYMSVNRNRLYHVFGVPMEIFHWLPWHEFFFFISRYQVTPSSFYVLRLTLQESTVISIWIHSLKLTCPRTSGLLGLKEDVSSL